MKYAVAIDPKWTQYAKGIEYLLGVVALLLIYKGYSVY